MDQERVTLMPPGGIKRTARSIENLGDTRGMVSKNGTIHFQNGTIQHKIGTIHCQKEQYKTKLERYKPTLLKREKWEGF